MKKKRVLASLILVIALVFFTGCGKDNSETGDKDLNGSQVTEQDAVQSDEPSKDEVNSDGEDGAQAGIEEEVTLFIGTANDDYKEVKVKMGQEAMYGDTFDEELLKALEEETGWNLNLEKPISDIEGGKTIVFSEKSGFVVGPPKNQKEEYFVYDSVSYAQTMLDSIQKTFDMNLTDGNPQRSLSLFVSVNDKPIKVDDMTIPNDKPWKEARALVFG